MKDCLSMSCLEQLNALEANNIDEQQSQVSLDSPQRALNSNMSLSTPKHSVVGRA